MPLDTRLPLYKFQTDPIQFKADIITPFIQAQQLRSSKLSNEATLKDMADKEKIKKILSTSVNPDGSYDFQSASQRLANSGFLNESESVRKYGVQLARDKGLEDFNKMIKKGFEETQLVEPDVNPPNQPSAKGLIDEIKANPDAYPDVVEKVDTNLAGEPYDPSKVFYQFKTKDLAPEIRNEIGENTSFTPTVEEKVEENGISVKSGSPKDPTDLYLEQQGQPTFKKSYRDYTYPEAVSLYLKTVPFSSEKEATDALELLKTKSGNLTGVKLTDAERKDKMTRLAGEKFLANATNKSDYESATNMVKSGDILGARRVMTAAINRDPVLTILEKTYLAEAFDKAMPTLGPDAERKENELDLTWSKVFSIPENAQVLQKANDFALKGDMSKARNLLIGSLNKVEGLTGSQKGALIDRVLKNYPPVPLDPATEMANAIKLATEKNSIPQNLSPTDIQKITDLDDSIKMLDALGQPKKPGATVGTVITWLNEHVPLTKPVTQWSNVGKDVATFNQLLATVRQIIGKGLEGGVLRKEDEEKYKNILPDIADDESVFIDKMKQLRVLLESKKSNTLGNWRAANYKTPFKDEIEPPNDKPTRIRRYDPITKKFEDVR